MSYREPRERVIWEARATKGSKRVQQGLRYTKGCDRSMEIVSPHVPGPYGVMRNLLGTADIRKTEDMYLVNVGI